MSLDRITIRSFTAYSFVSRNQMRLILDRIFANKHLSSTSSRLLQFLRECIV